MPDGKLDTVLVDNLSSESRRSKPEFYRHLALARGNRSCVARRSSCRQSVCQRNTSKNRTAESRPVRLSDMAPYLCELQIATLSLRWRESRRVGVGNSPFLRHGSSGHLDSATLSA